MPNRFRTIAVTFLGALVGAGVGLGGVALLQEAFDMDSVPRLAVDLLIVFGALIGWRWGRNGQMPRPHAPRFSLSRVSGVTWWTIALVVLWLVGSGLYVFEEDTFYTFRPIMAPYLVILLIMVAPAVAIGVAGALIGRLRRGSAPQPTGT